MLTLEHIIYMYMTYMYVTCIYKCQLMGFVLDICIMCLISYSYNIIYIKWETATLKDLTEKLKDAGSRHLSLFRTPLHQDLIGNYKKEASVRFLLLRFFPVMFLHIPASRAQRQSA